MNSKYRPIVLVILDGWGEWDMVIGNPLMVAKLPTINWFNQFYPKTMLEASGMAVGLPWGVMGNSEVGHQTIGAGQIVFEPSPTIDMAIQSGEFNRNQTLLETIKYARDNKTDLHVWGLLSDGGVHSRLSHLFALLEMAKRNGLAKVYIHAVMDGRDTPPRSGQEYVAKLKAAVKSIGIGEIATLCGRYWAMDRNKNWDRIEKSFLAFTQCTGQMEKDPAAALAEQYRGGIFDEYIEPVVIVDSTNKPVVRIKDNDAVICFNFRGDRAREMTRAFVDPSFKEFKKAFPPQNIKYAGFTSYEDNLNAAAAFPPRIITTRLGEIFAQAGKRQLRIAETEKYAHVTYFFNGGAEKPFVGEDRILVPSKNVSSYSTIPEMSAYEITDKLIAAIETDQYDFVLVNYANPDMVGHTGVFPAGVKAVEHVDICLAKLVKTVFSKHGCLLVTADHGNIEEMIDIESGGADTKHSSNPVPFWLVGQEWKRSQPLAPLRTGEIGGMLVDISATVLDLGGLSKPADMSGRSLVLFLSLENKQAEKKE